MTCKWATDTLGKLCDILDHKRIPITKKNRIPGEYPYFGATGVLDYVEKYIFDEKLVLVGEDGAKWESGETTAFPVNEKCWVNNHAHVLRPNRSKIIDEWIIYFLNFSNLSNYVTGLTVPKLNQAQLRSIPIPFPELVEQKRIVSILDESFEAIDIAKANTEKNLQNARALFERFLKGIFSGSNTCWKKIPFDKSINKITYTKKVLKKKFLTKGEFPIISQETDYINGYWNNESELFKIKTPVVIFGDHTRILKYVDFDFIIGADGVKILEPKEFLISKFYYYQLLSCNIKPLGYARHYKLLKEINIQYPEKPEQERIIDTLDAIHIQIMYLESIYQKKLTALEELKKSLLHQAFNGGL